MSLIVGFLIFIVLTQLFLFYWLVKRNKGAATDGAQAELLKSIEKLERVLREEMSRNREEAQGVARGNREEINQQLLSLTQTNEQRLERMRETIESRLRQLQ